MLGSSHAASHSVLICIAPSWPWKTVWFSSKGAHWISGWVSSRKVSVSLTNAHTHLRTSSAFSSDMPTPLPRGREGTLAVPVGDEPSDLAVLDPHQARYLHRQHARELDAARYGSSPARNSRSGKVASTLGSVMTSRGW